ncbi:hypothetical protein A176_005270 [Myxococcus hansupus]|uniref:Uncharacterized protein n=1 Tax=Pseudomyxococcus hansupus TaxID=1297742 RepID=A0A0H4X388_9BACT|nr:hypothetical protein A176_005270 [Myxococcus hansupus]
MGQVDFPKHGEDPWVRLEVEIGWCGGRSNLHRGPRRGARVPAAGRPKAGKLR